MVDRIGRTSRIVSHCLLCGVIILATVATSTLAGRQILLSCQPRVTVMSCFVYTVIRDLESIDHLCINPICRRGLIHK